jgi:exonuclease SbcC
LEQAAKSEPVYRQGLSEVEANLLRLDRELKTLVEQLEVYKDLDARWAELTTERDATADAYRTFLANESEAKLLDERQKQLDDAQADQTAIAKELTAAEKSLNDASAGYDSDKHNAERVALLDIERSYADRRATLEAAKRREEQLAAESARFAQIRKSLQGEFKEKERLENVAETTAFIRDTLKEAAPRVARNYVYHVSLEANQMFREITGNAERTLKWTEDYSIVLEEDGYERPYPSLSGGEQMAAALSVRLTLLKQLSDVRIAFFDEPTTNLDVERRENLALQISRITHFDQLFVISHDDTFDNYVDHVIAVGE